MAKNKYAASLCLRVSVPFEHSERDEAGPHAETVLMEKATEALNKLGTVTFSQVEEVTESE